jgi:protein phosphatase
MGRLVVIKTAYLTDTGRTRELNEDAIYASEKPVGNLPNLFIVADGMGGHNAGDFASTFTVDTLVEEIGNSFEKNPSIIFQKAIQVANQKLREIAAADLRKRGMGTTVVAATCMGKYLQVANVGDSRLYVVNDTIKQITTDHSYVEEMIKRGNLQRENARSNPNKNIITRAVGAKNDIQADIYVLELKPGDLLLMCSDGLSNMLEDEEMRMIIKRQRDIVEMAEKLVEAANENGGKDNISVILIDPFADEVNYD